MEAGLKTKKLRIDGMTCINCQNKIQKKLQNTAGISKADVSYNAGTAVITYDTDIISLRDIADIIHRLDYEVLTESERQSLNMVKVISLLIIIFALFVIMEQSGILNLLAPSQLADSNMGYGMLFVIGLVTSVHCVAMCGGINLSQCIPKSSKLMSESRFSALRPAFLYNLGRIISYTVIGFIVGALGSTVTFSTTTQGVFKLIAGIFMLIMGINMLGIFPWLRTLNPRMPKILTRKINERKVGNKSPFYVGLLGGLMPCGPLQAMQIYALSTGSPFSGALSMMLFSLGTVPLMFGFGALSTILSGTFTKKIMTIGAVLVVVLGLSMLSQGWSLAGFGDISGTPDTVSNISNGLDIAMEDDIQIINSTLSSGRYPAITVQVGIPVKWIIDAPQGSINGCNNRIFINEYDIEHTFKTGENIIEFMPTQTGKFSYSCWMGMIRSSITVVEAGTDIEASTEVSEADSYQTLILPTDTLQAAGSGNNGEASCH